MEIGHLLNAKSPKIAKSPVVDRSPASLPMNQAQLSHPNHLPSQDRHPQQVKYPLDQLQAYPPAHHHHHHQQQQQQQPYVDNYPYPPPANLTDAPAMHNNPPRSSYDAQVDQSMTHQASQPMQSPDSSATTDTALPKAFACATCRKGFARRSDLVRHERIHSGHRPHVCAHPGCDKQFIQRSALTVHERVHTGEKPHMCTQCSKPFSDSSSLARHRRIHSGTRPYQCPYANCLKTFTRRTTLTRHMNQHSGTVEQSTAARAAALASSAQAHVQDAASEHADGDDGSEVSSSPSASHLPDQGGYVADINHGQSYNQPLNHQRQSSDFYPSPFTQQFAGKEEHQYRNQASPSAMSANSHSSFVARQPRQAITSNPVGYAPPPVLEPRANSMASQAGNLGGSPQPHSMSIRSSVPHQVTSFAYPDPHHSPPYPTNVYYPAQPVRRVGDYDSNPQELQQRILAYSSS